MMELELTIWQRAILVQVVNGTRGDVRAFRMALRALEVLEFTEEEREEIGLVEEAGQMRWQAEAMGRTFTIALEKPELRFIRNAAEGFQGWPVAQAGEVLDLLEKLGVSTDEERISG